MAQQPISNAQLADISGSKVIGDITGKSANVNGVVAIANGGTGKTTAEEALNALLPDQTGKNTYTLRTNGTTANWAISGTVFSVGLSTGTTGLTVSGTNPITTSGTLTLSGTLAVTNGGTGGTNRLTALTNLLPVQSPSTAGLGLISDGAQATWQGIVSSVDLSTGTTGLTVSGGPITSSGTFTLGGTLAIANGGTGKTTRQEAIDNLVPVQTGQTGKFLSTNGATVSWQTVSATPGGSSGAIQFNNSGAFGGDSKLTYSGTGGGTMSVGAAGVTFSLRAADGTSPGYYGSNAGGIQIRAGDCSGGAVLGSGGSISLLAGSASPQLAVAGSISLTAGDAVAAGATAGSITLKAGLGGTHGNIVLNNNKGATTFTNDTRELARITNSGAWSFGTTGTATGTAGQVLTSGGPNAVPTWTTVSGTGTVTSVDISGGTTGLTTSGGPVTGAGTITLGGTLATANGGTGLTTFGAANRAIYSTAAGTLTANTLPVLAGGTGQTSVPGGTGQLLWNNTNTYAATPRISYDGGSILTVGLSDSTFSIRGAPAASQQNSGSNLVIQAGTGTSQFSVQGTVAGNMVLAGGDAPAGGKGGDITIRTGVSSIGSGILYLSTGAGTSTERLRILPNGAWGLGGANYGAAGQTIVSAGSGSPPTWAYPSVVGSPSPATNATTGFAYIPVTNGTPTGVPTAITGYVPMMADSSGNRLWIYIGGSWKSVALA